MALEKVNKTYTNPIATDTVTKAVQQLPETTLSQRCKNGLARIAHTAKAHPYKTAALALSTLAAAFGIYHHQTSAIPSETAYTHLMKWSLDKSNLIMAQLGAVAAGFIPMTIEKTAKHFPALFGKVLAGIMVPIVHAYYYTDTSLLRIMLAR